MTSDHSPRYDDLLPAYALGALEGEELRELREHVATGCPVCAVELRRLAATLEELADFAAVLPEELAGPAPALPGGAGVPEILAGAKSRLLAQISGEGEVRAFPVPPAPAVSVRRWPLLAAAAVLALVAVWGVVRQASMGAEIERLQGERRQLAARADVLERRLTQMQSESERLARTLTILAAPKVQSVSLAGMGTTQSAVGRTYIDAAGRQAVFYASNLPALGPDKSYQLWYLDEDDQKTSAGVFDVDAHGKAALVIDQPLPLERIQGWVVTIEPRGGRPQPTGSIAMAG
ncbi:MAG TPA: anti-sigma factor [Thermoanaerobaculia bacterium]|nr:anti-sigma factor [Thermoanaerobaculia bacterium]